MGQYSSAYLVHGTKLPAGTRLATVESTLDGNTNGIGHLDAGPYDSDTLYLTTYCESADLGKPKTLHLPEEQHPDWDRILDHALGLLDIPNSAVDTPAWLLIADVS